VDGKIYTKPITVKLDPRVKTPLPELQKQYSLSDQCYNAYRQISYENDKLDLIQDQVDKRIPQATGALADSLKNMHEEIIKIKSGNRQNRSESLISLKGTFINLMNLMQGSDMPVTLQASKAVEAAEIKKSLLLTDYDRIIGPSLKKLNDQLGQMNLETIHL
jgi:hypothetical protein